MLPHKAPKQLNHSQLHKYNATKQHRQWKWQTKGKAERLNISTCLPLAAPVAERQHCTLEERNERAQECREGDNKQLGAPQSRASVLLHASMDSSSSSSEWRIAWPEINALSSQAQQQKQKESIRSALCSIQDKKATTLWVNMCRPHPYHAGPANFFGSHGDAMTMSMTTMTITTQCGERTKNKRGWQQVMFV